MTEADRLFARLAIKKNWVEPGQVEEARTYQEKLAGGPAAGRLVMALPDILERLGRLNKNQIAAVEKEMEPHSFPCEQCGGKGFHLEFGDESKKCEKCRGQAAAAATVAGAPAPAPAPAQRGGGGGAAGGGGGRPSLLANAKTSPYGADTGPATSPAPAPAPAADMTKRRARAASYDMGGGPPSSGERAGAAGLEGQPIEAGPSRLGAKPSGLGSGKTADAAAPKKKPPTENKTVDISAEEIISATRSHLAKPPAGPEPAKPDTPPGGAAAPPSKSSGIVADQGHDTNALLGRADLSSTPRPPTPQTPAPTPQGATARTPAATGSLRMRAAPGTPAQDPLIGKVIGGCRIDQFLGRGGMGTVYKANQVDLDRTVAFKVLAPQLTADPKQVAQFLREAKALAKLEHPNIVAIYNAAHDKDADIYFIVMQYIAGGSLEGAIKREQGKVVAQARAAKLIEQAARGLLEAHIKGITHRDVKPDNMLLAEGDVLKVTDFGLARMDADAAGFTFAEGRIVGTPYYMSPEQIDGRNVDSRTDIYALGATMYYLLTGQKPFTGDTPVEILLKHVNEVLVPPAKRSKDVPESLSKIVEKAMAKDPDRRYQSLRDFLRDIEDAQKGKEVKVELAAPVEGPKGPDPDALFSSQGGVMAPRQLAPIQVERPRSFYYSVAGLGAATLLAIAVGLGPIREIMAAGSEEVVSPRERDAERALATLTTAAAATGPGASAGRELADKLKKLSEDHPGTVASERAASQAVQEMDKVKKQAEARRDEMLARSKDARAQGKHGLALEALTGFPKDLAGFGVEKQIEDEAEAIRKELAGTRRQAYISAGAFVFGENDFKRTIEVQAYYIDLHEVTNREYAEWVRAGGGRAPADWVGGAPKPGREELPVTGVSARDAETYARSKGKRLPNVQEWERAARGDKGQKFPWGEGHSYELANNREGGGTDLEPVTARPKGASPVGALNMAGNAAEWAVVPAERGGRELVWVKGGAFENDLVSCRGAFWNDALGWDDAHPAVGFRLAQNVER